MDPTVCWYIHSVELLDRNNNNRPTVWLLCFSCEEGKAFDTEQKFYDFVGEA